MKTLITMIAITLTAFTARAGDTVPYIAMPVGFGYAIDAKGIRQSNAMAIHNVVYGNLPAAHFNAAYQHTVGLFRLDLDLSTGRVRQVTMVKSTGAGPLDKASAEAFRHWVFRAGMFKEVVLPITVKTRWVAVSEPMGWF
jgi:hypothetical protein